VFTNIAAYLFSALDNLTPLRERLRRTCRESNLRGTILLSREGVNLFVAGEDQAVQRLIEELRAVPGLEQLTPKVSYSETQPFNRMLVKIKREIIAFGVEGIDPGRHTAPRIAPRELKRWLDEGRPVTLLDTRNDYEVQLGTFRGARTLGLQHFRDFPAAVDKLPESWSQQPIVMFCTGGIRCEKAGAFMQRRGFDQVYQLEGGILRYFEECGAAHFEGECFVFDQRVGLDPGLHAGGQKLCFVCRQPVSKEQQSDPHYVAGVSCPACYRSESEQIQITLAARQARIREVTTPLPGSRPYTNQRPVNIPGACDRLPIVDALQRVFPHLDPEVWRRAIAEGRLLDRHERSIDPSRIVRGGECFLRREPFCREPDVASDIRILHEDDALIVVNKPAPLPMHPCGRFNRNTLQSILCQVYHPQVPCPVHRLDANTSGVVVLTRSRAIARKLQTQFEAGGVRKNYLALVHGHPDWDTCRAEASIGQEASEIGTRVIDNDRGSKAATEFSVVQRRDDNTTLLAARPLTGRTNQIRLHLAHAGLPIVGDATYVGANERGDRQTLSITDPPLCLFAQSLRFDHPVTRREVTFEAPLPAWLSRILGDRE